jgi:hypothetical protein
MLHLVTGYSAVCHFCDVNVTYLEAKQISNAGWNKLNGGTVIPYELKSIYKLRREECLKNYTNYVIL